MILPCPGRFCNSPIPILLYALYEAEQVYRWIPACQVELDAGEHVLHVYALASGMRYDRFYLARGEEQPPMDLEWQK